MQAIKIILEGDRCWPDLKEKLNTEKLIHLRDTQIEIAALSKGMKSGKPSISMRIDLPDGKTVLIETSMRLFIGAAVAFEQRYAQELKE
ncbi:MAG: hypothetical protein V3U91_04955 [Candidatus Aminicenantaceae bacterium]